jgi:hypothetical protein
MAIRRLLVGLALLAPVGLLPAEASAATHLAWAQVAVATVWDEPSSPQPIDAPALENPARIEAWMASLTVTDRLALDSQINTQVLLGDKVVVLARRHGWSEIEIPDQRGSKYPDGIIGWVPSAQLSPVAPPAGVPDEIVGVPRAWLYRFVDNRLGRRAFLVSYDTELPVLAAIPGYLVVGLPGGKEGAIATGALDPVYDGTVSGAAIVLQARQFLGLPYLWGGTSGFGYDCSGLVYALHARYGLYLPRDVADQQHAGTPVSLDELQAGDLLFFGQPAFHVAIYVGRGLVIDSPYSGASVEMIPMTSIPVWNDFSGAIRVTGVASD